MTHYFLELFFYGVTSIFFYIVKQNTEKLCEVRRREWKTLNNHM